MTLSVSVISGKQFRPGMYRHFSTWGDIFQGCNPI